MYDRFLRLRREHMRAAYSKAIRGCRAFFENMSLGGQWLELVYKYPRILCDSGIGLRLGGYRGDEVFGQHGGGVRAWGCRSYELVR